MGGIIGQAEGEDDMKTVTLREGITVPALGQGTWHMGERGGDRRTEAAALRLGLDLGLTLIDTAEMYADGGAEEVVAEAIAGLRQEVFLVSKVYPHNAGGQRLASACERSLARLKVDCIDLYLLHWRGNIPLADTVEGMRRMQQQGKIRLWGVSNLDVDDLEELGEALTDCAADQVLYNLSARGADYDLLPFCRQRGMAVMAYTPVGQGSLLRQRAVQAVAARHGASPAQVAIAWTLRAPGVISIPKAANPDHVRDNAAAAALALTPQDLAELDAAFPAPKRKRPLEML
jgi:diketogulonate reductase-like aldo/keto reductase